MNIINLDTSTTQGTDYGDVLATLPWAGTTLAQPLCLLETKFWALQGLQEQGWGSAVPSWAELGFALLHKCTWGWAGIGGWFLGEKALGDNTLQTRISDVRDLMV